MYRVLAMQLRHPSASGPLHFQRPVVVKRMQLRAADPVKFEREEAPNGPWGWGGGGGGPADNRRARSRSWEFPHGYGLLGALMPCICVGGQGGGDALLGRPAYFGAQFWLPMPPSCPPFPHLSASMRSKDGPHAPVLTKGMNPVRCFILQLPPPLHTCSTQPQTIRAAQGYAPSMLPCSNRPDPDLMHLAMLLPLRNSQRNEAPHPHTSMHSLHTRQPSSTTKVHTPCFMGGCSGCMAGDVFCCASGTRCIRCW